MEAGVEQETIRNKIHFWYTGCRCGVLPVTRHVDERQAVSGCGREGNELPMMQDMDWGEVITQGTGIVMMTVRRGVSYGWCRNYQVLSFS